jgi:prolyl-tRNA editing enzyme YbaK/EbsC (Cys-tRNA(Pro) deacylase)
MLQDFLEANGLNGKVISFRSDTSIERAAESIHVSKSSFAKAFVFADENLDWCVVIADMNSEISAKEASKLFEKDLDEVSGKDIYRISGVEKEFFPPVGVFGVTTVLDKSVDGKKNLFFKLSPREYLVIDSKDILKANEF